MPLFLTKHQVCSQRRIPGTDLKLVHAIVYVTIAFGAGTVPLNAQSTPGHDVRAVGRYAVAPGIVDDVHMERGHPVATITGYSPGAVLVPVSASVFSPDGVGALISFERDATGRVTGYVQGYADGRVVRRTRLP